MTDKVCAKTDCNAPRFNNYDWCQAHMQAEWRKRENIKRSGAPPTKKTSNVYGPMVFEPGEPVTFQVIEWVGNVVIEFTAYPTGNITPIPETTEADFARLKDAWIDDGSLMAIVLRGEA